MFRVIRLIAARAYMWVRSRIDFVQTLIWWGAKKRLSVAKEELAPFSWNLVDTFYINLDSRLDRAAHMVKQFNALGLSTYKRFAATKCAPGILGCNISHRNLLASWQYNDYRLLMVCEDDAEFLIGLKELEILLAEFMNDDRLDVLCLGFNVGHQLRISEHFCVSRDIQTTSAYVIKSGVEPYLCEKFNKAVGLARSGLPPKASALDVIWKELQGLLVFVVPVARAVKQVESYSDIENKVVNYGV